MNTAVVICIAFFILIVMVFLRKPMLWILRLCFNGCVGLGLICVINASNFGFSAGINPFTSAVSALLGVPGAVLVCILNKIL